MNSNKIHRIKYDYNKEYNTVIIEFPDLIWARIPSLHHMQTYIHGLHDICETDNIISFLIDLPSKIFVKKQIKLIISQILFLTK